MFFSVKNIENHEKAVYISHGFCTLCIYIYTFFYRVFVFSGILTCFQLLFWTFLSNSRPRRSFSNINWKLWGRMRQLKTAAFVSNWWLGQVQKPLVEASEVRPSFLPPEAFLIFLSRHFASAWAPNCAQCFGWVVSWGWAPRIRGSHEAASRVF